MTGRRPSPSDVLGHVASKSLTSSPLSTRLGPCPRAAPPAEPSGGRQEGEGRALSGRFPDRQSRVDLRPRRRRRQPGPRRAGLRRPSASSDASATRVRVNLARADAELRRRHQSGCRSRCHPAPRPRRPRRVTGRPSSGADLARTAPSPGRPREQEWSLSPETAGAGMARARYASSSAIPVTRVATLGEPRRGSEGEATAHDQIDVGAEADDLAVDGQLFPPCQRPRKRVDRDRSPRTGPRPRAPGSSRRGRRDHADAREREAKTGRAPSRREVPRSPWSSIGAPGGRARTMTRPSTISTRPSPTVRGPTAKRSGKGIGEPEGGPFLRVAVEDDVGPIEDHVRDEELASPEAGDPDTHLRLAQTQERRRGGVEVGNCHAMDSDPGPARGGARPARHARAGRERPWQPPRDHA